MFDPLSDDAIFSTQGPGDWLPLMKDFGALRQLAADKTAKNGSATEERAGEISRRILESAAPLAAQRPTLTPTRQHERWFSEAVLAWISHRESAGAPLVDTVGSRCADRFPIDVPSDPAVHAEIRNALADAFHWPAEDIAQMQGKLDWLTSNLKVKQILCGALADWLGESGTVGAERIHRLANQVFGPLPLRPGDVDLVLTPTAIFFCLPFDKGVPTMADLDARPASEQEAVRALIKNIEGAMMRLRYVRFPAFGLYDPDKVDPELIDALVSRTRTIYPDIHPETVLETLGSMITILPGHSLDKYLVHDIWGHGWQESVCEFEWLFERMAELDRTSRRVVDPGFLKIFRPGFSTSEGRTTLDPDAMRAGLDEALRERIETGVHGVMAECLADLAEYKFMIALDPDGTLMPSSSLMRTFARKFDFTLDDIRMHQKSWSRPFRALVKRPDARRALCARLVATGLPSEGLADAVDAAAHLVNETFGMALSELDDPTAADSDGQLCGVDLSDRLLVANALIGVVLEDVVKIHADRTPPEGMPAWKRPTASMDLAMIAMGWFYEQNRRTHLWCMDILLRDVIVPLVQRFEDALTAAGDSPGASE